MRHGVPTVLWKQASTEDSSIENRVLEAIHVCGLCALVFGLVEFAQFGFSGHEAGFVLVLYRLRTIQG